MSSLHLVRTSSRTVLRRSMGSQFSQQISRAPTVIAEEEVTSAVTSADHRFPVLNLNHPFQHHQQESSRRSFSSSSVPQQPDNTNETSAPLMERSEKGLFARFMDKYSIQSQTNRILVAECLLQAAITQASDPRWYGPGRIPRDYRNYQAILTMHVWFLHKRLILDQEDPFKAGLIQEELFDIFWTDSTNRMRHAGVQELLITKDLKKVQQYTFMHCFHYDHCYTGELLDNPKERFAELKNLVFQHILLLKDDDSEESTKARLDHDDQATRIAWYIETQYQNIVHDLPQTNFEKAHFAWVDLPDFTNLKDGRGKILGDNPVHADDILPEGWMKNIANDGSFYYWNTETRESQWERPEDVDPKDADDHDVAFQNSSKNFKT